MEPATQPTFIPRETPTFTAGPRAQGRGLPDLLVLLSIVLFVASTALAGGIFLYGEYLQSSTASKIDQLERAQAAFEPSLIQELTRLDDRMRSASTILGSHIAPTALFRMFEQSTIETVAFNSLDFTMEDGQNMSIEMEGVAASVNSIALQADVFSKGGMITSPIFSDIDRELDGVHFSLSAILNPAAINFAQLVAISPIPEQVAPSTEISPFGSPLPSDSGSPQGAPPSQ